MHAIHTVWIYHLKMIFSGLNNIFLFDWLFKWTLRRVHSLLVYSWVSGGAISPQVGPGQSAGGDWGRCPQNSFSAYAYKTEGNEHIKKWDFSLALRYECNRHVYYTKNRKLFLRLCKTCFSWYFYKRAIQK